MAERIPEQTRTDLLQAEIRKYLAKGYTVQSQTATTAQLIKSKKANCCLALITLPLAILRYITKSSKAVYLEVDEFGQVHRH